MNLAYALLNMMQEQREKWIKEMTLVDISPVARWYYDEQRDDYDLGKDFPVIVPPWQNTWMEFVWPESMRLEGRTVQVPRQIRGKRAGAQILSVPVEEEIRESVLSNDLAAEYMKKTYAHRLNLSMLNSEARDLALKTMLLDHELPSWIMFIRTFLEDKDGNPSWCGEEGIYLNDLGGAITRGDGSTLKIAKPSQGLETFDTSPFLFALTFLHCKNVALVDGASLPPKVQAKREKRGIPTLTFKTLTVESMRKQARRESEGTGESSLRRSLHIARGHFKDYRNGGGLFGKYQGLYWWDMHVRGSAEVGEVVKDYRVKPPKQDA